MTTHAVATYVECDAASRRDSGIGGRNVPASASSLLAVLPARRWSRRVLILLSGVALLATFAEPAAARVVDGV